MKKVVVVAPTYNEIGNIEKLIDQVFSQQKKTSTWEIHLLVVDSHSKDGTVEVVKKMMRKHSKLHLLETPKEGLGRAYINGFKYAENKINPYLVMEIDADGQHDPDKIPEFLREIEKGADFVIGTRYSKGGSIPSNWGLHRKILSMGANLFVRLGFMKLKQTEWTNGYRAIKMWLVKKAYSHLENYSGYVFQVAFMDYALKNNAVMAEIPVHFKERKYDKSKINAFQYTTQVFLYTLMHSSFVKFGVVGFLGFFVDFGISYLMIERLHRPVWLGTLLSTEIAIISNFILNNYWSFAHKKIEGFGSFIGSFIKFNLVSSGSIAIQTFGMQFLTSIFGKSYWAVYKVGIIFLIVIPYSYVLYNKVVWKNK